MKEQFVEKRFSRKSQMVIHAADEITNDYATQGFDLSLRQLYYQFVSRNLLANTEQNYDRLGSIINDARLAGLIDWDTIVDRGRQTLENSHWTSPKQVLEAAAQQFRLDRWRAQPVHVEVMVEKQALEGVLVPVCRELDIPFTANKGYSSASALKETAHRMRANKRPSKSILVLYLGDHDPSGIDMTRDVYERLALFLGQGGFSDDDDGQGGFENDDLHVRRLALNMDQIEQYQPPPNPAKMTDSRAAEYVRRFGNESWELDALEPTVLADLVRTAVEKVRDTTLWQEVEARETQMKGYLLEQADRYRDAS
jgi:hypothetical protein